MSNTAVKVDNVGVGKLEADVLLTRRSKLRLTEEVDAIKVKLRDARVRLSQVDAKASDSLDNNEVADLREEITSLEQRKQDIKDLLNNCRFIEDVVVDDGKAGIGKFHTIEADDGMERYELVILGRNEVDLEADPMIISHEAPLAMALAGHREGDTVSFSPPEGSEQKLKIISVSLAAI